MCLQLDTGILFLLCLRCVSDQAVFIRRSSETWCLQCRNVVSNEVIGDIPSSLYRVSPITRGTDGNRYVQYGPPTSRVAILPLYVRPRDWEIVPVSELAPRSSLLSTVTLSRPCFLPVYQATGMIEREERYLQER